MLSPSTRTQIVEAVRALQDHDPWTALGPMSELAADGVRFYFDFTTVQSLGTPILVATPDRGDVLAVLTPRQREVAILVTKGASNKAIARQLGIAPPTVKDHVHAVLSKLALGSRTELAALVHAPEPSPGV